MRASIRLVFGMSFLWLQHLGCRRRYSTAVRYSYVSHSSLLEGSLMHTKYSGVHGKRLWLFGGLYTIYQVLVRVWCGLLFKNKDL